MALRAQESWLTGGAELEITLPPKPKHEGADFAKKESTKVSDDYKQRIMASLDKFYTKNDPTYKPKPKKKMIRNRH